MQVLSAGLESDSESPSSPKTLTPMQQLETIRKEPRLETIEVVQRHKLSEMAGKPTIRQRRLRTNLNQGKILLPLTEPTIRPTRIETPWNDPAKQYGEFSDSTRRHKFEFAKQWGEYVEWRRYLRESHRPSYWRERSMNM